MRGVVLGWFRRRRRRGRGQNVYSPLECLPNVFGVICGRQTKMSKGDAYEWEERGTR